MEAVAHKRFSAGFTVTELVVVMVIVGILTAIGTPTFKYVTTSNRIAGEINGLLGDMQYARTEAIKNGQTVSICTSSAAVNYASCTSSSAWQSGWIVFLDFNASGVYQPSSDGTPLRIQPAFSGTDTFVATSANYYAIAYNRMGYAPTGSNTTINIQLHDSTDTQNYTRCLAISPIGAAMTETYGQGSPACQ
jgi:type IV fimbrial biogenesis protein FimT